MKKLGLVATALISSIVLLSGTAWGEEETFSQYAQTAIQKMETEKKDGPLVETGISFTSMEEAKRFAAYFYRNGYWGEVPVKVTLRTWSDQPCDYELQLSVEDAELAAVQHRKAQEALMQVSDSIAAATTDQRGRAEAVYDWIYDNIEYDSSLQNKTVYTALTTGKTICNGYAEIFRALCKNLDMSCEMIYGENHVWNRVMIDGQWLYTDITWDKNLGEHRWRLVTEEEWNQTHPVGKGMN